MYFVIVVSMEKRQVVGVVVPSPIDVVDFHDIAAPEMQAAMSVVASLPFQHGDNLSAGQLEVW